MNNIPIDFVAGSHGHFLEIILNTFFGITEKFSIFFFREFSENGNKINKFQNAISRLGIPPDNVIAFENEELEITDAIHAGIKYINPIID